MAFQKESVFNTAKTWIKDIGQVIRTEIDQPRQIDTKTNPNDLVTEMDKKVERFFAEKIRTEYPDHQILSEEGFGDDVKTLSGTTWIIDPIDGTMNFIHQKRHFAISVAVFHDHIGEIGFIYDVMGDVLYAAKNDEGAYKNDERLQSLDEKKNLTESIYLFNTLWTTENNIVDDKKIRELVKTVRGVRTYGSAALEFCYLAEGIADGYVSFTLHPWDFAAGAVILKEVGGVIKHANGRDLTFLTQEPLVAGHKDVVDRTLTHYIELK
ncbi:inositol monophosphatase family protein [Halolactibacillus sp. JCM 19043]|uniref:inositol monophosphatase family protein n=1 Tax=Halolactibacillus sp. JCM 19043 TaxID=1460638 RepID=UPI000781A7B3|nr:inositol monophosphatase family protein [Halolactibacillus sp. JCM 19043]